jgi:hypothetical protein
MHFSGICVRVQVSAVHMRVVDGVGTLLQMQARCC